VNLREIKMEEKILKIITILEEWKEKEVFKEIDRFYKERLKDIRENRIMAKLKECGKTIFHLIPFESFSSPKYYNILEYLNIIKTLRKNIFFQLYQSYNFDGLFYYLEKSDGKYKNYIQIFLNGIIEVADCLYISANEKILYIRDIEDEMIENLKGCLSFQKELGIKTPIIFYLTFLGAKGFSIKWRDFFHLNRNYISIDREDLMFPKIIVKDFDEDIEQMLRPTFDRIWNACGYEKSAFYDENGKRKAK
jgi:hypothetical protein